MPKEPVTPKLLRSNAVLNVPVPIGNTRKIGTINPAKHWVFTLNNYTEEDICALCQCSRFEAYSFQEEIGEEGTPHLQGYVRMRKKCRPLECGLTRRLHWEKCKSVDAAIQYTQKVDTRKPEGRLFRKKIPLVLEASILKFENLYPWQMKCVEILRAEPHRRKIYWYYETVGGVGKSELCKYIYYNMCAVICSGKSADIKYAIIKYKERNGFWPEVILYDIPRTSKDYISWEAVESIKNGLFFSTKYESESVLMPVPHVCCFANFIPPYESLSKDRWKVVNLEWENKFHKITANSEDNTGPDEICVDYSLQAAEPARPSPEDAEIVDLTCDETLPESPIDNDWLKRAKRVTEKMDMDCQECFMEGFPECLCGLLRPTR